MSRKSKSQYQFNVGDRVAERPKPHGIFTQCDEACKRIAQYCSQWYGVVLNTDKQCLAFEFFTEYFEGLGTIANENL